MAGSVFQNLWAYIAHDHHRFTRAVTCRRHPEENSGHTVFAARLLVALRYYFYCGKINPEMTMAKSYSIGSTRSKFSEAPAPAALTDPLARS